MEQATWWRGQVEERGIGCEGGQGRHVWRGQVEGRGIGRGGGQGRHVWRGKGGEGEMGRVLTSDKPACHMAPTKITKPQNRAMQKFKWTKLTTFFFSNLLQQESINTNCYTHINCTVHDAAHNMAMKNTIEMNRQMMEIPHPM